MSWAWALLLVGIIYFFWKYPALRRTWYWPPRRGLVAFMYHHIRPLPETPDGADPFSVSPELFEKQLLFLKQNGYTAVSEAEIVHAYKTGETTVQKPVLLTFDDGHADNYTTLFPLLKKYQIPALIFLITDSIGTPGYLTWEQINEMKQSGLVSFGSHTCSHRRLRSLSDEEIEQEVIKSKHVLEEKLHTPVYSFCYPFGAGGFDKRVRPLILKAGYLLDFSTQKGVNPWPWKGKSSLRRAFPRGGENLWEYHLQLTRGRSRL
ncbi:polysaccharide deacetylase family protein [Candidatus Avelusimicrobium luingense]|uniref:polysaccharide deacetylase family protein n=1 Tax=Candidatus Avelusimicrobium luingense TaxID=3416211 RepID=UPI003D121BC9